AGAAGAGRRGGGRRVGAGGGGGAGRLRARGAQLLGPPVVHQVLADPADGDEEECPGGGPEGAESEPPGLRRGQARIGRSRGAFGHQDPILSASLLPRAFSLLKRRNTEIAYAPRTAA